MTTPLVTRARVIALMGALAAGGGALALATDRIIGPDDGIYLATARSLAESGMYSLSFLPAPLVQTKYPPLYPACLAIVGALTSFDPPDFWHFKIVNALVFAAIVLVGSALASRERAGPAWTTFCGVLLATTPALCSFVDLLASDLLLAAQLLAAVLIVPSLATPGGRVWLTALAASAVLGRTVGVALGVGLAWHAVAWLGWRRARPLLLGLALGMSPWFLWRAMVMPGVIHPIDVYYLAYEPSAWSLLAARPAEALGTVWTNLIVYPTLAPMVLGWSAWWLVIVAAPLALAGVRSMDAARRSLIWRVGAVYALALLGHPYPIDRYVLPLAPLAAVGVTLALAGIARGRDLARHGAAWLVASMLVGANVGWLQKYASLADNAVHGAFGRPLHFGWDGFAETLTWIRDNTRPTDVVASFRDAVVYSYTGRRGVRAWLHVPETWSEEEGRHLTAQETAVIVRREYHRLGVQYLLVSPGFEDVEGRFGEAVLDALGRGSERLPRRFVSRDGRHAVYAVAPGL